MNATTPEELAQDGWRARELPGHMGNTGPLWTRRTERGWSYGLLAADKHLNPAGIVHGGVLLTLLDHVISTVAWEATGRRPCVTIQIDAQFLAAVQRGSVILVTAQVARQTRELVFMRGEASVEAAGVACAQAVLKIIGEAAGGPALGPRHLCP